MFLFRNLTSFKQMEDEARGDVREGCHVDSPDNDVTLENLTAGGKFSGRFSMRTSLNTDKVFVFCMTTTFNQQYFGDFESDMCVEITNSSELIRRRRRALAKLVHIDETGLLFGNVEYYWPNADAPLNIQIPKNIPFMKHATFSSQHEFRIVYGRKNVFKKTTKRLIIDQNWDTEPDHLRGNPDKKFLKIGSIKDIARTISRD